MHGSAGENNKFMFKIFKIKKYNNDVVIIQILN